MSEEKITVIRARHDKANPYFASSRATAQNRELSWEARGVLWYLLSKPSDWEIVPKDLEQGCGKGKVYGIIKELKEAGYLIRDRFRDDKGKFVWGDYRVYEHPSTSLCEPFTENPEMDNRDMGKPFMENPPQHIKDSTESKTDIKETEQKTTTPPELAIVTAPEASSSGSSSETNEVSDSQSSGISAQLPAPDENLARVSTAYQENIGLLTQMISDRIKLTLTEYPADWIVDAIAEAVLKEKRFWGFVEGVLKNWKRDGKSRTPTHSAAPPPTQPIDNTPSPEWVGSQAPAEPAIVPEMLLVTGKYGLSRKAAWDAAMSQYKTQIDQTTFQAFVEDAVLLDWRDGCFVVQVKNTRARDICKDRIYRTLKRILMACYGDELEITFEALDIPQTADDRLRDLANRLDAAKAMGDVA